MCIYLVQVYYYNKVTGATTWSLQDLPPTPPAVPSPRLPDLGPVELQGMREQEHRVASMKERLVVGDRPGSSRGEVEVASEGGVRREAGKKKKGGKKRWVEELVSE